MLRLLALLEDLLLPGGADLSETTEDELEAHGEGLDLVRDVVVLAPLLNAERALVEAVAGHLREQVVLNLIVETAGEPVHEEARGNVTSSVELEVDKVELAAIVGVVQVAGVVRSENDDGDEAASHQVGDQPPRDSDVERGHGSGQEGKDEDVMQKKQGELPNISATQSGRHVGLQSLSVSERLQHPDDTQKGSKEGEVVGLVGHKMVCDANLRSVLGSLEGDVLNVPDEQGQVINIRVIFKHISDGVVVVVTILPPVDRVSLTNIRGQVSEEVIRLTRPEDIVVSVLVSEPSTLLPENAHRNRGQNPVSSVGQDDSSEAEGIGRQSLVDVETIVALHEAFRLELLAQFAERLETLVNDGHLSSGLVRQRIQHLGSLGAMESIEDIGGILLVVLFKNSMTSRMLHLPLSAIVLDAINEHDRLRVRSSGTRSGVLRRDRFRAA